MVKIQDVFIMEPLFMTPGSDVSNMIQSALNDSTESASETNREAGATFDVSIVSGGPDDFIVSHFMGEKSTT